MTKIDQCVADTVRLYEKSVREFQSEHGEATTRFIPNSARGSELVIDDGRRVPRRCEWIEVPNDAPSAVCAARHLLRGVCRQRGRIWFQGEPVHVIRDDGIDAHPGPDGFDVIRLRTLYYHEADAVQAACAKEAP